MATSFPDVLVLGGGVIGLATAYHLARDGVRVEVLDRAEPGQESSWAGAGIIPPGNPARARMPYERLLAAGSEAIAALAAELHERTGIDTGYRRCGGIEVVREGEEPRAWAPPGVHVEALGGEALRRLEPRLVVRQGRAYHLPDMAQVRNPRYLKALLAACLGMGVDVRAGCPVDALGRQGDRLTGVETGTGRRQAGQYLVAAGAWSDGLLRSVGWRPGVRPVRGQIALLNPGRSPITRIIEEGKNYLVPRPDGRVLVGATEEEAGFDKRTTAAGVRGLLEFAMGLVPDLAEASLERSWAGLRPGSPDGMPFLGAVPGVGNLFLAAGHFRAGLQLSAITGAVMADLLQGRPARLDISAFRPGRAQ